MGTIADTRAAIATALNIADIRATDYSPANLSTPCAVVGFPTSYDPGDTMSTTAAMTIPVSLFVAYAANRAAEDALEALIDNAIDALETGHDNWRVVTVRDFGTLDGSNGPVALGCTMDISTL